MVVESSSGGLVGRMQGDSTVEACYATGTLTGNGARVGGLVGRAGATSSIVSCYASVSVTAYGSAGGLVGGLDGSSSIVGSYATGSVTRDVFNSENALSPYAGGLVGGVAGASASSSASIVASYATGSVTSTHDNHLGGLAGRFLGTITASYATGTVEAPSSATPPQVGRLVGSGHPDARGELLQHRCVCRKYAFWWHTQHAWHAQDGRGAAHSDGTRHGCW